MCSNNGALGALGKRKRISEDEDDEEELNVAVKVESEDDDEDPSDSDDSDGEDQMQYGEGTGVVEYHEDDEAYPECAAYDKDFMDVGKRLVAISKTVIDIFNQSSCNSNRVQGFRRDADELAHVPQITCKKIALLGNTGAGKCKYYRLRTGIAKDPQARAPCSTPFWVFRTWRRRYVK